jgi:hypothetical protein
MAPISFLFQLVLAIGVPALIALWVPLRWRICALALWIAMPLLVLLVLGGTEIASGKASPADLDKLFFGIALIGSVLALPWLAACGLGYGLGAFLRRLLGPSPVQADTVRVPTPDQPEAPPESVAYTRPAPDPTTPTLSAPSGWQAAHIGFDHDDLVLDGLPVWSLSWREEAREPVMLAHPAYPTQLHRFRIYTVDDGTRATRFAAAELSNTVWGFYRWIVPADAASGASADGALRYEHDLGPLRAGRYDAVSPIARLWNAATGALLFDGSAWTSSRIVPQSDGSMLLSLEQNEQQTIFRIDPATGTFRDLAGVPGMRPVTELAAEAAAARAACDDPANTYLSRWIAPDGSMRVDSQAVEWSNTHWVRSPRVLEIATGRVLLDLWGTDWDASVSFPNRATIRLSLRRYHFGGGAEAEIDLAADRYTVFGRRGATSGPLVQLPAALETEARLEAAEAPPRPKIAPSRPTAWNWFVALLILLAALLTIALATMLSLYFQPEPAKQKLDTIPPMPSVR